MQIRRYELSRCWRHLILAAALIAGGLGLVIPAKAALQVPIDRGVVEPIPMAIPDFLGGGQAGRDVATVVRADLERSGLFRSLNPASFIEKVSDINTPPRFGDWRTIQAQGLVTGQAIMQPDGRLKVDSGGGIFSAKARWWACNI